MTVTLSHWAKWLGGEARGGEIRCPGPGHSRRDRSLAVRLNGRGGVVVYSHAGDDWRACRDYVNEVLGLDRRAPVAQAVVLPERAEPDEADRIARALAIWRESVSPTGSPVTRYLRRRGLELPTEAAGEAIRFHPSCPAGRRRAPAMVCLVRDVVTGEPCGIHRTFLTTDGRKVEVDGRDRAAMGRIKGGAIMLTPFEDVCLAVGIGEGLETTLSMRHVAAFGPCTPIWCCLHAGNVETFPVLGGVESLWVCVDRDEAGERAADAVSARWADAGREVLLIEPRDHGRDLNDLIIGGCDHA